MSKLSIEHALAARAALIEPGADPLDPEVEQRLLALLVERALPLLLRCLQKWYSGARLVAHICWLARLHCSSLAQKESMFSKLKPALHVRSLISHARRFAQACR